MKGQAPAYWVEAKTLVTGLFDGDSDESTLLQLAACNQIELHATSGTSDARASAPSQVDARYRGVTAIDAEYTGSAVRSRRRWIHRVG